MNFNLYVFRQETGIENIPNHTAAHVFPVLNLLLRAFRSFKDRIVEYECVKLVYVGKPLYKS
jgi:hypothetical protein